MSFGEFLEGAGDFLLEHVPVVGKIYTGIKLANAEEKIDELENSLIITKAVLFISFILNVICVFTIIFLVNADDVRNTNTYEEPIKPTKNHKGEVIYNGRSYMQLLDWRT
jgi:heme/copper-type cytochrome/quinol oxidase subunit 2